MKPDLLRFNDIKSNTPFWDYHIHTDITDGTSTIKEYIETAIELKLHAIAFTEHVRKNSEWYSSFVEYINTLRESYKNKIRIFHGIETKVLSMWGDLDATQEMLDTAELILGSVHRFPPSCVVNPEWKTNQKEENFAEIEFQLSKAIIKNPSVDVLAHPGGMFMRKFNKQFPKRYLEDLLDLANKTNTAVEINSSYLKDHYLDMDLFSRKNPYVSLGSDAHSKEDLGTNIRFMKNLHQKV